MPGDGTRPSRDAWVTTRGRRPGPQHNTGGMLALDIRDVRGGQRGFRSISAPHGGVEAVVRSGGGVGGGGGEAASAALPAMLTLADGIGA